MSKRTIIQVFEHQSLKVDGKDFKKEHYEDLVKYNYKNKSRFFKIGHELIKFTQFVGVLKVRNLIIEVLPKAEPSDFDSSKDEKKIKWQKALCEMIRISQNIEAKSFSQSSLEISKNSILDIYFEYFLKEVEFLCHFGLVKKYRTERGNINSLKGKLLLNEQITRNLVHKEKFWCEYSKYDQENIYNQILKEALKVLQKTTSNPSLNSKCLNLSLYFEEIEPIKISPTTFKTITFNRKTESYKEAIKLAKLILLNYSPCISPGSEDILAILFDMNDLYEKYILNMLRRATKDSHIKVKGQGKKKFWKKKEIKPDIIIQEGKVTTIIDTKWKVLSELKPDDNDLKQIYSYNKYFKSKKSFLFYPEVNLLGRESGSFHEDGSECVLEFVNLFDSNGALDKKIGQKILEKIKKK